ncbi:unnamed protein product [Heligmosomoides polygyrus]|uniref:Pecanex-like protein n=1 Tax=Heligmosomoides polygyrus TaxID=6339 RepID=A0A183FW16_HELPZ|nr:unnamed protein product [Heligmosomoides polygyrus]
MLFVWWCQEGVNFWEIINGGSSIHSEIYSSQHGRAQAELRQNRFRQLFRNVIGRLKKSKTLSGSVSPTHLTAQAVRQMTSTFLVRCSTPWLEDDLLMRIRLHQSSENLRMPSDNLRLTSAGDGGGSGEGAPIRTRSISNLRGANALEAYGTFDADHLDSASSLMHSRLLARSVGNVSSAMSGGESGEATAASRLQNTIDMLKKASNPDLTQCSLYEDPGSPCGEKMRRRGAVQKKVERYHPRHRAARNQTSEESDSNGSDASPLSQSISRRLLSVGNNRLTISIDIDYLINTLHSLQGRSITQHNTPLSRKIGPSYITCRPVDHRLARVGASSCSNGSSSLEGHEERHIVRSGLSRRSGGRPGVFLTYRGTSR